MQTTSPHPTRAWVEIDLDAVRHNLDTVQDHIGAQSRIMAVAKADAYGHGIEPITRICDDWGVHGFAVIGLDEALRVRSQCSKKILVMGYLDDAEIEEAIRQGFSLSLYDAQLEGPIRAAARRVGRPAHIHLKIETGLNRLGMTSDEALRMLSAAGNDGELRIEAVFTHLSNSANAQENARQMERFQPILDAARTAGAAIEAHMAKSHALKPFPESYLDYVRVGLAVYGFEEVIPGLRPALSAKTVVMQRKKLRPGEGVSYGHIFKAPREMEIAVLAMGYAEGLSLSMSERIDFLISGRRARQIGRICMNLTIVDVTEIPAERGDIAVAIGAQGDETIKACDIAERTGLRQHEIVTRLGRSLPKIYHESTSIAPAGKPANDAAVL